MSHEQSESINELATALAKAQGEITGAIKNSENPFFKSKYADLPTCMEAIREPLSTNSLSIIQTLGSKDGAVIVYTTLAHSSGQWIRGALTMTPEKRGPQGLGTCISYARRYSLGIVGLVQLDDDADSATDHEEPKDKVKGSAEPAVSADMQQAIDTKSALSLCSKLEEAERIWTSVNPSVRKAIGADYIKQLKEKIGV